MTGTNGTYELVPEARETLDRIAGLPHLGLVVVDGFNAALALHGLKSGEDTSVATFFRLVLWPLRSTGAAVLVIDHVVKDEAARGRFAAGSAQKLNMLDGASFVVKATQQPGPGKLGKVRLTVAKDRHGGVRAVSLREGRSDVAGLVVIDSRDGAPVVRLEPPEAAGEWRPTYLMERISPWLELQPEPVSQHAIEEGVRGKAGTLREATSYLVRDGFVGLEDGPRGAILHRSIKPYREPE